MPNSPVTDITTAYNVALITVDNLTNDMKLISGIFSSLAQQGINIDMINQAPPYRGTINLSFSMPADDLVKAISTLNSYKSTVPEMLVEVDAANTKVSVYGEYMRDIPGVAAKLFTIFANNGIDVKLVTTSETDISYLIYDKDTDKAVNAIKKEFRLK